MYNDLIDVEVVKPYGNRLCVLPLMKESETTQSGLIIPTQGGKREAYHGRVVAIGPGYVKGDGEYYPLDYKIGDIVLYGRGAGTEIKIKGVVHLILTDDDVTSIFTGKETDL